MQSRCRWPPESPAPPWPTAAFRPFGRPADEVVRLRTAERLPQVLVRGRGRGHPQVSGHGAGEEVGLLWDHGHPAPEVIQPEGADVPSAEADLAADGVQETRQQIQQRGLSAAGGADDGCSGPGRAVKEMPPRTGVSAPG